MTVEKGKQVTLDYTLTVDGDVVDTSEGKNALEYVHGEGKLLPGLAEELKGMKEGQEKQVTLSPENAFGEVNKNAFREVPKTKLPKEMELKKGMVLQASMPKGGSMPVTITEVKPDSVIINYNHPLAGKTLVFDVKVVSVK